MSHEHTVTFESDGKHHMIPSVVGGQRVTPKQAVDAWAAGKNPPLGTFPTKQHAEFEAINRSRGGHTEALVRELMKGQ